MDDFYAHDKVISSCALFGCIELNGRPFSGALVARAIANMHVRGNGLGGGFAVYGLYPQHKDEYALHIMYQNVEAKKETDRFLDQHFDIVKDEEIPTRPSPKIVKPPIVWRYFAIPRVEAPLQDDYVVEKVMAINTSGRGSCVFSSGKDMGVFKGVGYAEDIFDFYRLDEYEGYIWLAHSRFPTNTPSWWGGAHPFSILDCSVVHNGEISSYGTNRRYLEMYGYRCTFYTDTEVLAYAFDLLVRRHRLSFEVASKVLAPPFWSQIEAMEPEEKTLYSSLRRVYPSLLINGPFSIIVARRGELLALTDRIRLRPLTAGLSRSFLYLSSEEAAIRLVCPDLERVWTPKGGEPIIARVGQRTLPTHKMAIKMKL
ncbi:MAG: glutamine amidotransferase family protein [Nitrososphaerota archaeon]